MRFSILSIAWMVLYVALALASLRHPSEALVYWIQLLCCLTFAMAAVIAFDRRSTPFFAFVAFGAVGAMNLEWVSGIVVTVMLELEVNTGANEYGYLQSILSYHLMTAVGMIGYVAGCIVRALGVSSVEADTDH